MMWSAVPGVVAVDEIPKLKPYLIDAAALAEWRKGGEDMQGYYVPSQSPVQELYGALIPLKENGVKPAPSPVKVSYNIDLAPAA